MTPNFLRELRRRHVYRVAVAYGVTAWLLIQLAATVLPTFGAPDWVLKVVIALLALFFPVALILSWAFELTPEGVRRTVPAEADDARPEAAGRRVGRALDYVTVLLLVLAVGLLAWRTFGPARSGTYGSDRAGTPAAEPMAGADTIPSRSVAVLPFESLSADASNAYFASGMQDMILTKLAAIQGLRVISRASTEPYGSRPANLRSVALELGVATILEGTVQRDGDQVLINVQLIDAGSDAHVWAQDYTRTLESVFGVEGEVAQKVADALRARLTPAERRRVATAPTSDAVAYDLYLRADAHARKASDDNRLAMEELPQAIPLFQQALARDTAFGLAAAALAQAHLNMYWFGLDRTDSRLAAAKVAVDRALAIDPDMGEAHLALGLLQYWGHRDYARALDELQKARRVMPGNSQVEYLYGAIARRQGEWGRAVDGFLNAAILDPRNTAPLQQLALTYEMLRRYADADSVWHRVEEVHPNPAGVRRLRAWNTVLRSGDLAPLRRELSTLEPATEDYRSFFGVRYFVEWASRDYAAATRIAREDTTRSWTSPSNVVLPRQLFLAWARQAAGDAVEARRLYSRLRARAQEQLRERPDDPDLHLALAFADAGLGLRGEAVTEARTAAAGMPMSRDAVTGGDYLVWLARLYVRVGDDAHALESLRRAMDAPTGGTISPSLLRIDPVWDPLRTEPAFQDLLVEEPPSGQSDRAGAD